MHGRPAPIKNCRLQAAGQSGHHPEIQTQRFLAPTCFPSLSLRCSGWAARSSLGRGGGLAGSCSFQSKRHRAGMYARTHIEIQRCTPHTHTHTTHTRTLSLFHLFLPQSAQLRDSSSVHARNINAERRGIVEMAKFSAQLGAQFLRWSSLQGLRKQNTVTEVFHRRK